MFAEYPSLKGRGVLITGGGSGIGASLVRQFATQGAQVAFLDVAEEPSLALTADLGGAAHFIRCNLADVDALREAVRTAGQRVGPIRVLVNNAGWDQRHAIEDVTEALWDSVQNVNLRPHFFTAQAVVDGMADAGGGSIINISSIAHRVGVEGMPGYLTAKAGIVGLTRALARDLGPKRIRVNAVLPGWVKTERQVAQWLNPQAEAQWLQAQCLKEMLEPEDVSRLVLFLAADDSRMITAQSYVVDGGRS